LISFALSPTSTIFRVINWRFIEVLRSQSGTTPWDNPSTLSTRVIVGTKSQDNDKDHRNDAEQIALPTLTDTVSA
jgi:hypothetical protein